MNIRNQLFSKINVRTLALAGLLFVASSSMAQLRYEQDYPVIGYSAAETSDPFSLLMDELIAGEQALVHEGEEGERGYLDSLLTALDIDISSQLLVFSKSSLKSRFITAETPRAIYFNDEVYVAFIAKTRAIEVSAMDPMLGPVFFSLAQDPEADFELDRQLNRCLRCHDSYSLTGGGVPRFLLSSVLADGEGEIVSHEISVMTNTSTPLNRRWGGWYVSGTHGSQETMGNLVIRDINELARNGLQLAANGNKEDLTDLVDLSAYPIQHSDIVALLVLEHQVEVQNVMTKVNYGLRTLLDTNGQLEADTIAEITEPLVLSLLMANEEALTDTIEGTSGYTEYFQALGPVDSHNRSLREFDLNTRTFKYPLSYLIYSRAFDSLQSDAKAYVYTRLNEILSGQDQSENYTHLSTDDRSAILEILIDTKPDFIAL